MAKLLLIDTATDICSVALSNGKEIIGLRESADGRNHAKVLTVFIQDLLKQNNIQSINLDAVAVSMGPGSYTGLRIGVSVAKGICFGIGIPLISVPTLEAMYTGLLNGLLSTGTHLEKSALFAPMIDARRMEVYTCLYTAEGKIVKDTSAVIVDEYTFNTYLNRNSVFFFGSGAGKLNGTILHKNAIFINNFNHSAIHMVGPAYLKYIKKDFEDLAYFEPFYLKDFITTTSKKSILGKESNNKV
jgi:tRNA threonylcarbamoyladenosine biosynthesis protein TsaB